MLHRIAIGLALAAAATPAAAELTASTEAGFVSHHDTLVAASPAEAWTTLLQVGSWWNGDHTWSGDAANLSIEPRAGGCFCEALPGADGRDPGGVEHMRVVYFAPHSTLRLSGALGPLQAHGVSGVLTVNLVPEGDMTRIVWDFAVGGYLRPSMTAFAPIVDQVIGEQALRLAAKLGTVMDPAPRRAP
jgi:hypothetical protein